MKQPDYKEILENATDYAIFTMDMDRRIMTWNRGAERLLGWSKGEAIGKLGDIIFLDNEKEDAIKEIETVHEKGVALDERWHVKKDGILFFAVGRTMSIVNDVGEIEGYIKIMLDQTEKKQQEHELKELNATLEKKVEDRTKTLLDYQEKLRSLVVELNTTEDLERKKLADDLHDNLAQLLALSNMKLDMTLRDLPDDIDSSGIYSAKDMIKEAMRYTRELMSDLKPPTELDRDLLSMMEWLAHRKKKFGLQVDIKDDGEPKPINDELTSVVFQSVRELLMNVIKHSEVDKALMVLEQNENHIHISVKDEGKGFDPKEMEGLPKKGFGLFNLKERLNPLGGSIDIKSQPGKGTTVTISVPMHENFEE